MQKVEESYQQVINRLLTSAECNRERESGGERGEVRDGTAAKVCRDGSSGERLHGKCMRCVCSARGQSGGTKRGRVLPRPRTRAFLLLCGRVEIVSHLRPKIPYVRPYRFQGGLYRFQALAVGSPHEPPHSPLNALYLLFESGIANLAGGNGAEV